MGTELVAETSEKLRILTRMSARENLVLAFNCEASIYAAGHAMAQLVEALRYKPEGRRFHSRCFH
jgi:hypothetical protein